MGDLVIRNAAVVLADEVVRGCAHVVAGRIDAVDSGSTSVPGAVDLEGDYLVPGLVELHTDNFERHLMPRPKVRWPEMPALLAHDAEVVAAGITTVYDALGVGDADEDALRGRDMRGIVRVLETALAEGLLRAEHRLHIRCELPAPNTLELFAPFEGNPRVGLISLMDHTPGQRQWSNIDQARVYYTGKKGWSEERFQSELAEAPRKQARYAVPHRRHFVEYARARGIPLASHDDTLPEHVAEAHTEGVSISEFPTSVAAAAEACAREMAVVMGAPNMVRGGSHSGNVATVELARRGLLDTLSSDYVPASLMLAAFMLFDDAGFTLPQAIATVSRNPARSVGLADRGEIAPGQRADLVRVRDTAHVPAVMTVWRGGVRVG
jgi:alpha-D-ribose 1-methylphosphonate 5-triphosphate diphosphatase